MGYFIDSGAVVLNEFCFHSLLRFQLECSLVSTNFVCSLLQRTVRCSFSAKVTGCVTGTCSDTHYLGRDWSF